MSETDKNVVAIVQRRLEFLENKSAGQESQLHWERERVRQLEQDNEQLKRALVAQKETIDKLEQAVARKCQHKEEAPPEVVEGCQELINNLLMSAALHFKALGAEAVKKGEFTQGQKTFEMVEFPELGLGFPVEKV